MRFRFPPLKRLLKKSAWATTAFALLLLLAGCSKLKLGYEYADWLVIYAVEDNFELEKAQRVRFKDGVESYFRWHRKSMLPQYADLLSAAADSLGKGLRPEGVDSGYAHFKRLHRLTMEPTLDKAADLLLSLSPEQVENWLAKQQRKNQKLKKDFSGSIDERLERRYEKTVDELQDWTGKLSKDQKRQMRELSRSLPWNGHLWIENREHVQVRLAALLKAKPAREEVRKFMEDYFLHPERLRSKDYNLRIREMEGKTRAVILRVYALLTPQQRRNFRTRIELLSQDFRNMSRQE